MKIFYFIKFLRNAQYEGLPRSLETFPAPEYNCAMPSKDLAQKIYAAVRLIPRGKVASYSQVAALVGNCNLRRYVGNALHKNPSNSVTPCHRVVNAKGFCSGSFAFGGSGVQRQKLEAEGVAFVKGHVDMEKHAISQDDFDAMSERLRQEWGADDDERE